jgi:Calponin homology (CH) domain
LILGLIWTIILRFQIQDITIEEYESTETRSAKDALLLWCQMKTADYSQVNVRNFTSSWKDGLAFCALIHKHRPDLLPQFKTLTKDNGNHNLQLAFDVCEKRLGISKLLDPEDVNVEYVDEKSVITYIVTLYHYFSKMKNDSVQGRRLAKVIGSALGAEKMANEYEHLVSDLLTWIDKTIQTLNDRHAYKTNSLNSIDIASWISQVDLPRKAISKFFYLHCKARNVPINRYRISRVKAK